jgi:hypothetical protein
VKGYDMKEEKMEVGGTKAISDYTVAELKALCYDNIILAQQTQNNINLLQAEINKKTKI